MVEVEGVEPSRPKTPPSEDGASTKIPPHPEVLLLPPHDAHIEVVADLLEAALDAVTKIDALRRHVLEVLAEAFSADEDSVCRGHPYIIVGREGIEPPMPKLLVYSQDGHLDASDPCVTVR